jgi:hypothetical protein
MPRRSILARFSFTLALLATREAYAQVEPADHEAAAAPQASQQVPPPRLNAVRIA